MSEDLGFGLVATYRGGVSMNRNYQRGRGKEYRVRRRLLDDGWPIVVRAAGSHSPFDLIAITPPLPNVGPGIIELIQCKSGESEESEGKKAMQDIKQFAGTYIVTVKVE